ncbi:MAG: prepilin-type N-terminal cleavage/methylation domain-containing protein [Armatimonadota bacterium]|nr:prepilin-type N-terminal cleavage/methylation domain-containing protein [Armatimonadota bacterium]
MMRFIQHRKAFTLLELLIVIALIAVIAAMAVALWVPNRRAANETSAINSMRLIDSAEANYRLRHNLYGDLPSLLGDGFIPPAIAGEGKSGYIFLVQGMGSTVYVATASPTSANSGSRFFYTDEVGVIFQSAPTIAAPPTTDYSGQTPPGFGPIGN